MNYLHYLFNIAANIIHLKGKIHKAVVRSYVWFGNSSNKENTRKGTGREKKENATMNYWSNKTR